MTETEKREEILATLQRNPDPEHLWECIIAFQDYHFETISGLPFTYQLKRGRNGELTKELWIDRRKNSKSLAWSSVLKAFEMTEGKPVVSRPKALGDIRGVSYLYGIFYKFGLIDVPDDVIDLKELFWVLVGRWKMIFLAMLIGALLAGLYHTFFVKPSYQTDASIFITSDESVISVAGLQVSSELTADYTRIVKSRNVLKQVIKDLDLDMNYKQLGELVNITNPDDSHIITITVTCGDIELCRDIANSLLNIGIDRIYQVIRNSEPTVIDYSEAQAVEQVSKGLGKTVMMGAMFGIVLACGLIIVRFLTDTTLKTEDDIRKNLHMPVLSVIPYYEEKKE